MVGFVDVAVATVTPAAGETAQLWATPAVPVCVNTWEEPVHKVVFNGVNAAESAETTVTATVLVTGAWHGADAVNE
jgi:hypothetical protein